MNDMLLMYFSLVIMLKLIDCTTLPECPSKRSPGLCIFDRKIANILPPDEHKMSWAPVKYRHKLALIIIEPRIHRRVKGVVWNFAHAYGGSRNISLSILHSARNKHQIYSYFANWTNINLILLPAENFNLRTLSSFMATPKFWKPFDKAEFALIFQTDSAIFQPFPENYYKYDYIGAPWKWKVCNHNGDISIVNNTMLTPNCTSVGNGGLSIRRISTMKLIALTYKYNAQSSMSEDYYYAGHARNIAPLHIAKQFSVEGAFSYPSYGIHAAWKYLSIPQAACVLYPPFMGESTTVIQDKNVCDYL